MKLYINPFSPNARRARMAARILGLAPEEIVVDLQKGEQKRPEYLALNPNGKVPTLVDGDVVVWESIAIMMYLADQVPGQTFYPANPRGRMVANQWLLWTATHWSPAASALSYENFVKKVFGGGEPNEYAVQRNETLFKEFAGTLDKTLAERTYVLGNDVTIVDVAIASHVGLAGPAKLPLATFANVERWLANMKTLEAWKATEPPPFPSR